MTEHTNQYCNCHDCTQVRYKSSLAGQVDAAMNNAQPAAPPAPTAVQQSYCNICGQGVVDGTLACGHVYTGWLDKTPAPQGGKCFGKHGPAPATRHAEAQEPKAQDNPTWMDDCINVCSRHSLQFTEERDECFICTNRTAMKKERS